MENWEKSSSISGISTPSCSKGAIKGDLHDWLRAFSAVPLQDILTKLPSRGRNKQEGLGGPVKLPTLFLWTSREVSQATSGLSEKNMQHNNLVSFATNRIVTL